MVVQYPHTGKVYHTGASARAGDGNWTQAGQILFLQNICRAEPNKESEYVMGQNGQLISFSAIVYMPIPEVIISPGMLFEVWEGERLITKTDVKQFSKGQLNARVWL